MNPTFILLKIFKVFKILTLLILVTLFTIPKLASAYSDIHPGSVLETYLEYLSEKNIISGYPDGSFKPEQSINRAEALKIIFKTIEQNPPNTPNTLNTPFRDVPNNTWFTPYIRIAKEQNIISGYPDGSFKPGQDVNRAEFIKMAMKALPFYDKINGSNTASLTQYEDLDANEWYMQAISKAFTLNFLPKTNQLQLHKPMLRADATEIIYKISQYLAKHPSTLDPRPSTPFIPPESIISIDPLNIYDSPAIPKPAISYQGIVYEQTAGAQIDLPKDSGLMKSELVSGQLSLQFKDGCFVDFLRYPYEGDPQQFFEENLMIDEWSMFPAESQSWEKISEKKGYDYYLHTFTYMLDEEVLKEIGLPKTGATPYFITDTGYVLTLHGHSPTKEETECQQHVDTVIDGFSMTTL